MNGIAPLITILLGIGAHLVLIAYGHRLNNILRRFLAGWAIFGLPYAGLQMMSSGGPAIVNGTGDDFAAVLVGYFGFPRPVMAIICCAGVALFILGCFWLRGSLASIEGLAVSSRFRWKDLQITPTAWRRYSALLLALLPIVDALYSAVQVGSSNKTEITLILMGILVPLIWCACAALLIPWRTSSSIVIRNQWIFPTIVVAILFYVLGRDDYTTMLPALLPPVVTTAWPHVE
ncbi:hypothetical protein EPA93_32125 [Ktedonosporobacter rubrisoli]|uniref:Uncharacterized protein n=1 Tax=Ktedonosporobacter rubrisoli TaxID=2509675 RepID=A0A4V0YZN8_KTERU|nr:hypothetical protein [Ktedonosporobacter rubrisoli]QBD80371.1 hypothetical protein EPA93_32125 [Ktedonosporobacter rubrisoli]